MGNLKYGVKMNSIKKIAGFIDKKMTNSQKQAFLTLV